MSGKAAWPDRSSPLKAFNKQVNDLVDPDLIEVTQRSVLTDFDDSYAGIAQEDAEQILAFGQVQTLRVREISGWHFQLLKNIDIEMKQDGSRLRNGCQRLPRCLSRA